MPDYPTFAFETTAEEVATALAGNIKGKNVLITGTSLNGIGFEAARVIAKHANLLVITGYNDERLKLSEEALKKETPTANIRRLTLDLSSLAATRKAAAEVNAYSEPIHVLIHNAAAAIAGFKLTVDNLENQIATDHVAPFLLTKLILPKLLASASEGYTPRVVFVSSGAHRYGQGVDLELIKTAEESKHHPGYAYLQAKSANILTAIEISRRAKGKLLAYSLHPGIIMTNFNEKDGAIPVLQSLRLLNPDGTTEHEGLPMEDDPAGRSDVSQLTHLTGNRYRLLNFRTVAAAFDPRITSTPGAYLDDSKVATETVAPHSTDLAVAEKLWVVTEEIIGEKFEF
ncbi:NAD-P-binding protein [Mycena amicta]|nr:NAD-P-binding protein [Mycena amicta]